MEKQEKSAEGTAAPALEQVVSLLYSPSATPFLNTLLIISILMFRKTPLSTP
jgi:hypothetical protein